jgi:hypothetical protein
MKTPEALYSEIISGYTFSPRIRTGIAAGPNLQLTGLGFTRNSLLKKVSREPAHNLGDTVRTAVHREWCVLHSRAVHIARHSQLYICSDAGCTYSCARRLVWGVHLYIWKVSSHPYSCTDQVIQFVRVYTPYTSNTLKGPPYSHHERRRGVRLHGTLATTHSNEPSCRFW